MKVLGPNDGDVKLYLPDGFTTQQTIDESGVENTQGAFFSVAGVPTDEFEAESAQDVHHRRSRTRSEASRSTRTPSTAHRRRQIMLDAIAASDGTRPSVIEAMFATDCTGCFLGDFTFNENGDPAASEGAVVGFTIYIGEEELATETVFSPSQDDSRRGEGALAPQIGDDSGEGFGPPPSLIEVQKR